MTNLPLPALQLFHLLKTGLTRRALPLPCLAVRLFHLLRQAWPSSPAMLIEMVGLFSA